MGGELGTASSSGGGGDDAFIPWPEARPDSPGHRDYLGVLERGRTGDRRSERDPGKEEEGEAWATRTTRASGPRGATWRLGHKPVGPRRSQRRPPTGEWRA